MSRIYQYDKNQTYSSNLNQANLEREKRFNERANEIAKDKMAMDKLKNEMDAEEQFQKQQKKELQNQQFQEYKNYINQKYSQNPNEREQLNIKVGGEKRLIKLPSYNKQMEDLCINPTNTKLNYSQLPKTPISNYSEAGRRYQRGYSHGYNILTGEIYNNKPQTANEKRVYQNDQYINQNPNIQNQEEIPEQREQNYYQEMQRQPIPQQSKGEYKRYDDYINMLKQKESEEKQRYLNQQMISQPPKENYNSQDRENQLRMLKEKEYQEYMAQMQKQEEEEYLKYQQLMAEKERKERIQQNEYNQQYQCQYQQPMNEERCPQQECIDNMEKTNSGNDYYQQKKNK